MNYSHDVIYIVPDVILVTQLHNISSCLILRIPKKGSTCM